MLKLVTTLVLIISGCLINPKYTDPKAISEEQAKKYPYDAKQIRQQYLDYEKERNIKSSKPSPESSYTVSNEKTSGWSVGDPNALLHIGMNKYKYHHRINLTLVCEKNSFIPKPFGQKKIKWKISDLIFGETLTSLKGEVNIRFSTEANDRFHKITIITADNNYDISLEGYLIFELKQSECNP